MNNLVVNYQLAATIIDDQCSNTSSAVCESRINLVEKTTLVNDPQTLLDITSLGHTDDQTITAYVENAILLVDWAEHALYVNARLRVAHEGALFLKLTGEEIHTQVSVLTSLWRGGDADDLAGTPLKDYKVTNADELARDCDSVGWEAARFDVADLLTNTFSHAGWTSFIFDDHLFAVMVTEWVSNTIGGTLKATAEGVVFALVVVVTHVVAAGSVDFDVFLFDLDFFGRSATFVLDVVGRTEAAGSVDGDVFLFDLDFFGRSTTFVLNVVSRAEAAGPVDCDIFLFDLNFFGRSATFVLDVVGRVDAAAVVALGYVKLGLEALVSCLSAVDAYIDFLVVSAAAAVDVDVDLGIFVFNWSSVTNKFQSAGALRATVLPVTKANMTFVKLPSALFGRE
jgi:hypothetical protein